MFLFPIIGPESYLPTYKLYPIGYSSTPIVELNVSIAPDWFKELTLSWKVLPSWDNKEPRYNVYRSEVELSGYQKLTPIPLASPQYVDLTTRESSMTSTEFYIIETILNDDSVFKTAPQYVGKGLPRFQYLRKREIQRREWLLLRRFTGIDSVVFRKIRYGTSCSNCYDKVSRKIMFDYCTTCFGTSKQDGYYPGIKTFIQYDASADSMVYTYFGRFEANEIGAWTIDSPQLEKGDIVIRLKDYKVFEVKQVNNTEIYINTSRQIIKLEEQSKERVVFELLRRDGLLT